MAIPINTMQYTNMVFYVYSLLVITLLTFIMYEVLTEKSIPKRKLKNKRVKRRLKFEEIKKEDTNETIETMKTTMKTNETMETTMKTTFQDEKKVLDEGVSISDGIKMYVYEFDEEEISDNVLLTLLDELMDKYDPKCDGYKPMVLTPVGIKRFMEDVCLAKKLLEKVSDRGIVLESGEELSSRESENFYLLDKVFSSSMHMNVLLQKLSIHVSSDHMIRQSVFYPLVTGYLSRLHNDLPTFSQLYLSLSIHSWIT